MSLQLRDVGGVKVYDLSVGTTLPAWLSQKQRRSLRKNLDYRRRIELLQGFEFNAASKRICMSRDGSYVAACGAYPPTLKVYDTRELSLKFERRSESEIVDLEILSDGYEKLILLGADRTIAFHAAFGALYSTRIPSFGRALAYHRQSCDVFVASSSEQIFRLNLDQGRFMSPFEANGSDATNALALSAGHPLLATAGADGILRCWDLRVRNVVGRVDVGRNLCTSSGMDAGRSSNEVACPELTALRFNSDGLTMAVGTSNGLCALYDLRSSRPTCTKEHHNDSAIVHVAFQHPGDNVFSADSRIIKIWNRHDGTSLTNIECAAPINDVCVVQDSQRKSTSGLILVACEQERVASYYVPALGPAPPWAAYLDSLTEELEEAPGDHIYEDYKFVTRDELEDLGLSHLIGTKLLRDFAHGYFMHAKLFQRVQAVSKPTAFVQWRKSQIQKKIDSKKVNRIAVKRKLPSVNKELAKRMQNIDPRFSELFEDEEFEIDENSFEYRLINPSGRKDLKNIEEDDVERTGYSDDGDNDDERDQHNVGSESVNPGSRKKQRLVPRSVERENEHVSRDARLSLRHRASALRKAAKDSQKQAAVHDNMTFVYNPEE